MAVSAVISLGLGSPADIQDFLTLGLSIGAPITDITPALGLELYLEGDWVDVAALGDVRDTETVVCEYGIQGNTPTDRIASAGTLSFALDNTTANSGGVVGYYSLLHPDQRTGFDLNVPVRLVLRAPAVAGGAPFYKFRGVLDSANPDPGRSLSRLVHCEAVDIFDEWAKIDEPDLAPQLDKRSDELFTTLVDALTTQPITRDVETGIGVFPIAFDGGTGQKLTVRERVNQLCLSEGGYCYPLGDMSEGGTVRFESRRHRASNPQVLYTLSDDMVGVIVPGSRGDVYRSVRVTVHPTNDLNLASPIVLFALQTSSTVLQPGETNDTIFGPYRDPDTRDQIGGLATDPAYDPVAVTDYTMNSQQDGTGTDLTAYFTVDASRTAAGVRFTITNSGTLAGYLTKLQQRGLPIIRYTALIEKTVAGSYGDQVLELDLPYSADVNFAADMATYLAGLLKTPFARADSVTFLANKNTAAMDAALTREPGDRVAISETVTGLADARFTINSVRLEYAAPHLLWCTWGLEAAGRQAFWLWGVPGASEWDETTVYGF